MKVDAVDRNIPRNENIHEICIDWLLFPVGS